MAQDRQGLVGFINYLLEEKDGLVREKDELVESKIKLWQAMHQIILEKDAKIVELEHTDASTVLREENIQLFQRNQALEEVLRDLLNREDDDESEAEEDEQDDAMEPSLAETPDSQDESHLKFAALRFGDQATKRRALLAAVPPRSMLLSPESDAVSIKATKLPAFLFVPLILTTDGGVHQHGDIAGVAIGVTRSINSQLRTLQGRVQEGKSTSIPRPSYTSSGCLWAWMMKWGVGCRWTMSSPGDFACASCFRARRACSLWLGNMEYRVLPLPPAVRKADATWQDEEYYIHQDAKVGYQQFPGLWKPPKVQKK